jgi:hypothetical protein
MLLMAEPQPSNRINQLISFDLRRPVIGDYFVLVKEFL